MAAKKTAKKTVSKKPATKVTAKAKVSQVSTKDVAAKARKSAAMAADVLKANAAVAIKSGKTLAAGLKEIGADNLADSRKAVKTVTSDVKTLAKVKTVPEFVRLQGEQTARAIEITKAAFDYNVEALRTLVAKDVFPPVKARFEANLDLVRKAA